MMADDTIAPPRKRRNYRRLSEDERASVITRYKAGERNPAIAASIGFTRNAVRKIVTQAGVFDPFRDKCLHSHNAAAFDTITPESAYWIGFLMADGSVWENNITLRLAAKDRGHLEKFRDFLSSTHAITTEQSRTVKVQEKYGPYVTDGSVVYTIRSERLVAALRSYGVIRAKSGIAEASDNIKNNKNFWRGIVDGDGWVGFKKNTVSSNPQIGICGSPALLRQFSDFVGAVLGCHPPNVHMYKPFFARVNLGGRASAKISEFLYKDADIYLDRKYRIAIQHFGHQFLRKKPFVIHG